VSKGFGDIGISPLCTVQTLFNRLAGRGLGFR
jgi:K+ transporter